MEVEGPRQYGVARKHGREDLVRWGLGGGNPAVTMTRMYVCPRVQIDTDPVGPDMSLLLHLLL